MKNNIALTGMMGSGKSSVSKELSKLLPEYSLVDIDNEIEKTTNKKISEIFLKFGEAHFRMLETDKIQKFVYGKNQIISLGGGAFEDEFNRRIILENCLVIYLKTSPDEIYRRIKNETHRPLLAKKFSIERITDIIKRRAINYEKADVIIDTDNKSPYNIANEILGVMYG
ncbi:TPA: shikimate kinase [Candidatus Scatousia excrementigallinarum]|uniref:Shikimate kinase n=1 Tax=Candidatus Scatousia excrementigallinarum TaxID=2840935 RepID=A0A9D1EY61_9BACT|nr:shikimate kinase [Candidatus Scatousia excrementigallinarum]